MAESSQLPSNTLKTFETDGCTLFVDGTPKNPGLWRHCCLLHDMRYWFGGDKRNLDQADLVLKSCVNEVAGPSWAELIYLGVRTGHYSPIKNKTFWGWGWVTPRPSTLLSIDEITYIREEVRRLPYDSEILEIFIDQNLKIPNVSL